jgi:phosphoserine phosphatase RsbU/P
MFEGSTYHAVTTTLGTGEMLVLYSDGVTDAEDPKGQPFEEYGLQGTINTYGAYSAGEIGLEVLRAVEHHAQEPKFADDLTLLVMKRQPHFVPAEKPLVPLRGELGV